MSKISKILIGIGIVCLLLIGLGLILSDIDRSGNVNNLHNSGFIQQTGSSYYFPFSTSILICIIIAIFLFITRK